MTTYAWRRWTILGGEVVSPVFDTPTEAAEWHGGHPRRLTLWAFDGGRRRSLTGAEFTELMRVLTAEMA